jgi:hypothetical protein
MIEGTLDGQLFEATLMPSGTGPHWLPLRAATRKPSARTGQGNLLTCTSFGG